VSAVSGVLALQGDFAAHARTFARLGVAAREVRRVAELQELRALVIPGGESSTLLNLMRDEPWFEALRDFHGRGGALLGTCAGAILLAREVLPSQPSLGLLDALVERNSFGRQVDSFEMPLETEPPLEPPLTGVFIRAPRFRRLGADVEVLARIPDRPGLAAAGEPVLVRQGRILAGTFHPELTDSTSIHRLLLGLIGA
jgi:pyridoxal 5'-phosphate synthase pdxT subunit